MMQDDGSSHATEFGKLDQSFDTKFTDLLIKLIIVGFFAYFSLTYWRPLPL